MARYAKPGPVRTSACSAITRTTAPSSSARAAPASLERVPHEGRRRDGAGEVDLLVLGEASGEAKGEVPAHGVVVGAQAAQEDGRVLHVGIGEPRRAEQVRR